jgi:hypothetical protein
MNSRRKTNLDKGEDTGFKFVHIERPGAAVDQRVKRQVKSHVSRLQHRQERERQFAISRSKELEKSSETPALTTRDSSESTADSRNVDPQNVDSQTTHEGNLELQSGIEQSFSRGSVAFRTIALKDTENQVGKNTMKCGTPGNLELLEQPVITCFDRDNVL